jgi:hypothetical protein
MKIYKKYPQSCFTGESIFCYAKRHGCTIGLHDEKSLFLQFHILTLIEHRAAAQNMLVRESRCRKKFYGSFY